MERTNFIEGFTRDITGNLLISKNDGRVKIGKKQFESVATSIKRPKKLASKRFKDQHNAIEIQRKQGKRFEAAKMQVDMFTDKNSTEEIVNRDKFLKSKIRGLSREQKRMERNKKIGR